jgi:hypothetical protein
VESACADHARLRRPPFNVFAAASALPRTFRPLISPTHFHEEPQKLANHDYVGVGKRWPPAGVRPNALKQQIDEWRRFIDEFPWFPGTDDAYYLRAYAQYLAGDYDGVRKSIEEVSTRQFAEHDATPYVRHLASVMAFVPGASKHWPELTQIRSLLERPLAYLAISADASPVKYQDSLIWLKTTQRHSLLVNADGEDIEELERVAAVVFRAPRENRVTELIRAIREMRPIGRLQILFSRFFWPGCAGADGTDSAVSDQDPTEAPVVETLDVLRRQLLSPITARQQLIQRVALYEITREAFSAIQEEKGDRCVWGPGIARARDLLALAIKTPRITASIKKEAGELVTVQDADGDRPSAPTFYRELTAPLTPHPKARQSHRND